MKTAKLVMIATLLSFTAVSIANSDGFIGRPIVKQAVSISIENALHNPGLENAMHQQLKASILYFFVGPTLTVDVKYIKVNYRITGSYGQWLEFFQRKPVRKNSANRKTN